MSYPHTYLHTGLIFTHAFTHVSTHAAHVDRNVHTRRMPKLTSPPAHGAVAEIPDCVRAFVHECVRACMSACMHARAHARARVPVSQRQWFLYGYALGQTYACAHLQAHDD